MLQNRDRCAWLVNCTNRTSRGLGYEKWSYEVSLGTVDVSVANICNNTLSPVDLSPALMLTYRLHPPSTYDLCCNADRGLGNGSSQNASQSGGVSIPVAIAVHAAQSSRTSIGLPSFVRIGAIMHIKLHFLCVGANLRAVHSAVCTRVVAVGSAKCILREHVTPLTSAMPALILKTRLTHS